MLNYIEISGYKSFKKIELDLNAINILIGANGSGKSNLISFFKMVHALFNKQLQRYIIEEKADNLLYFGRKTTEKMYGKLLFSNDTKNNNAFWFSLAQTKTGGLYIEAEGSGYNVMKNNDSQNYYIHSNIEESWVPDSNAYRDNYLKKYLANIQIYHFHDTSATSMLRKECDINDNIYLKADGRNLPAFLYYLKLEHPIIFKRIEKTIQSIAPYIDRLILEPSRLNKKEIELRWVDRGDLNSNFSAYQFSDGTLRFIALTTVLLQPDPPSVIIIDEPELGLHPQAIVKLAALIKMASSKTQIIISTQSVNLVDCFDPENIITVDKDTKENQSVFKHLDAQNLKIWLEDHTLGELWKRNILSSAQPFVK